MGLGFLPLRTWRLFQNASPLFMTHKSRSSFLAEVEDERRRRQARRICHFCHNVPVYSAAGIDDACKYCARRLGKI